MKKQNLKYLGLVLGCCVAASAQAGLVINPQFDYPGDYFNGWTKANTSYTFAGDPYPTDLAQSVTSSAASTGGYVFFPPVGNRFLELKAGPSDTWVTVAQSVSLVQGQVIKGYAALNGYDDFDLIQGWPYNDTAAVWVVSGGTTTPLWQKSISDVGSQGHSPWEPWQFTSPNAGTYQMFFGVKNVGDDPLMLTEGKYASYGLFTVVPEPSTWLAGGLVSLMFIVSGLRQRRIA